VTATEPDEDEIMIDALLAEFKEKRQKEAEKYGEAVAEIVAIIKAKGYKEDERSDVMRLVDNAFPWEEEDA
jgi:hypothetical protein